MLHAKGFILDDERLSKPGKIDYFDELLERIRAIRSSEKRFYQKIRDIYTLSADYSSDHPMTQEFFKTVQNKLLYAVTGLTAAEIIHKRKVRFTAARFVCILFVNCVLVNIV